MSEQYRKAYHFIPTPNFIYNQMSMINSQFMTIIIYLFALTYP